MRNQKADISGSAVLIALLSILTVHHESDKECKAKLVQGYSFWRMEANLFLLSVIGGFSAK